MLENILDKVRQEFKAKRTQERIDKSKRFFKEEVKFYGLDNSEVKKIANNYFKELKGLSKEEVFPLCEELFASGFMEESLVACHWSAKMVKQFEPEDFDLFEYWLLEYINNWATCDTFCNHTVGAFLVKFPDYVPRLEIWTRSEDRWLRRGAAVSLIVPARKGDFLEDALEIATQLLEAKEDLVQKGYGWLLKEESKTHEKEVFEFVMDNKDRMPRTALRYAIEKMPDDLRKKAMEK